MPRFEISGIDEATEKLKKFDAVLKSIDKKMSSIIKKSAQIKQALTEAK